MKKIEAASKAAICVFMRGRLYCLTINLEKPWHTLNMILDLTGMHFSFVHGVRSLLSSTVRNIPDSLCHHCLAVLFILFWHPEWSPTCQLRLWPMMTSTTFFSHCCEQDPHNRPWKALHSGGYQPNRDSLRPQLNRQVSSNINFLYGWY